MTNTIAKKNSATPANMSASRELFGFLPSDIAVTPRRQADPLADAATSNQWLT
ncbi:hypothetical protein [Massilia sp. PWRC2]|uniref:hypothetical protein n=1 Tax=Massilia sp. PWRC2 TaxID=2804626 RepID=UPI003CF97005